MQSTDQEQPGVGTNGIYFAFFSAAFSLLIFSVLIRDQINHQGAKLLFFFGSLVPVLTVYFYGKIKSGKHPCVLHSSVMFFFAYVFYLLAVSVLNPDRSYDGFYYVSLYFMAGVLMVFFTGILNSETMLVRCSMLLALIASVSAILGILEYFGLIFYVINFNSGQNIAGTFGNQNYLGGFLCTALPFVITLYFLSENRFAKIVALFFIVSVFFAGFMTGSRNALVVLLFSACAWGLLTFLFIGNPLDAYRKLNRRTKITLNVSMVIILMALMLLVTQNSRLIQKLSTITDPEIFFGIRAPMYKAALDIWLDSPLTFIFGNGCGSYYRLSAAVFSPLKGTLISFDHVHNEILENLVEGGVVGLFLYAAFHFILLAALYKTASDNESGRILKRVSIACAASILAFQVHGIFSISTRTLAVVFTYWTVCGLSVAVVSYRLKTFTVKTDRRIMSSVMVLMIVFSAYHVSQTIKTESFMTKARIAEEKGDGRNAEMLYQKALEVNPENVEACYFLSHIYLQYGIAEGFRAFADRTERIAPEYRSITYFRGLMALTEGRFDDAERHFTYTIEKVKEDEPLTLYWLAVLERRKGNDDKALYYIREYIRSSFSESRCYEFIFSPGSMVRIDNSNKDKIRVDIGEENINALITSLPAEIDVLNTYYHIRHIASWFEGREFDLYAFFLGVSGLKQDMVVLKQRYEKEISVNISTYEKDPSKENLAIIIAHGNLFGGLFHSKDAIELRKRMLPYLIRGFEFKTWAYVKHL